MGDVMFSSTFTRAIAAVIFVTAAMVVSADLARAADAPNGQQSFDTVYQFQLLPVIKKTPSLERIFRDHPDVEANFRARARAAYEKGGVPELLEQSPAI